MIYEGKRLQVYPCALEPEIVEPPARRRDGIELYDVLSKVFDAYARLAIDPPEEARVAWEAGLQHHADGDKPEDDTAAREAIVAGVASGQIGANEIGKRLGQITLAERKQQQRERRAVLLEATARKWNESFAALRSAGDDLLVPLREVAADALTHPTDRVQEARYDEAHALATLMRQSGLLPWLRGATPWMHQFARPDLVHFWALDNARGRKLVAAEKVGDVLLEAFAPIDPPELNSILIAAFADDWKPGLYTAAEVLDASTEWITEPT